MLRPFVIFVLISIGSASNPYCYDTFNIPIGLKCLLRVVNPYGHDDFSRVDCKEECIKTQYIVSVLFGRDSNSSNFPSVICNTYGRAQIITANNVDMKKIGSNAFLGCTELEKLDLSNNLIEIISGYAFMKNSNLTDVNLENNSIQELPTNLFSKARLLLNLNLQNNKIKSIPANIFSTLAKLENWNLKYNEIQFIAAEALSHTASLEYINLDHNLIEKLPANVFSGLKHLKTFGLNDNKLKIINSNWFGEGAKQLKFQDIKTIYFINNAINAIDRKILDIFPYISAIDLTGNVCANETIVDKHTIQECYDNFNPSATSAPTTIATTTVSSVESCTIENMNEFNCELKEKVERLERIVEHLMSYPVEP